MRFKTNAKCGGCTAAITKALAPIVGEENIRFDLTSPDKVMNIDADVPVDTVVKAVSGAGFTATPID